MGTGSEASRLVQRVPGGATGRNPVRCPRTTARGAADGANGLLNSMKAVGPRAGNTSGRSHSQATTLIVMMAAAPLTAATIEMTRRSSADPSSAGMLKRARRIKNRIRSDRRCVVGSARFTG